jgi:hypothetical protein
MAPKVLMSIPMSKEFEVFSLTRSELFRVARRRHGRRMDSYVGQITSSIPLASGIARLRNRAQCPGDNPEWLEFEVYRHDRSTK